MHREIYEKLLALHYMKVPYNGIASFFTVQRQVQYL